MSTQALHQSLQQHKIDCRKKNEDDKLYVIILKVLGVGTIIVSTIITIINFEQNSTKSLSMGLVGLILLCISWAWSTKNSRELEKATEQLDQFERQHSSGGYT